MVALDDRALAIPVYSGGPMTLARYRSWLLGAAVLSLIATTPLLAVGPTYVMFYGDQLDAPVVHRLPEGLAAPFLWTPFRASGTIPKSLEGRPYVKYAIFWGRWEKEALRPEAASQHGRLYLPTRSEPGMVVMTEAVMDDGSPDRPAARPIPVDLKGFWKGWPLQAEDLSTAKRLGVPGL
jgi:hypothetical protein